MELFIYLLKSAGILTLFYFVYLLVLQKDTFFTSNRHFLIGGIIASLLLPFVIFTKTIYLNVPAASLLQNSNVIIENSSDAKQQISFNWEMLLISIYSIGIIFMSFRFIFQLFSVYKIINKYTSTKKNGYCYIKVNEDISPFSFFKYIVYNPKNHSKDELKIILKHEQSHASQLHSIDIVLSNLLLIVQWINPFAWFYKKSIQENLEFIADSETVQRVPSKTQYQLTLLKAVSSTATQPILANNFYQSLIKKRIIMLHKNQSATKNQWKLLLILPLLGVFLWSFNIEEEIKYNTYPVSEISEVVPTETPSVEKEMDLPKVSEKTNSEKSEVISNKVSTRVISGKKMADKITVSISKETTETELTNLKKLFKENYNVTLTFNGIKRNSKGEITAIKVNMKSENSNASFNQKNEDGISEFSISYDKDNDAISIGNSNSQNLHLSSKANGNSYKYEVKEDTNGNVSTWVTSDGKHKMKNKSSYVIRNIDEDNEGGEQKIHVISGDGGDANVWISKGHGNAQTVTVESDEESTLTGNVFVLRSGGSDNDEDSIFVQSGAESRIFVSGDDDGKTLIYINGKKSTKEDLNKLDSNSIEKIEVLKGVEATKKYGEEAKDGVILITTKKN